MKVLIIEPLGYRSCENKFKDELSLINKHWNRYKSSYPKCSIDLEFEYIVGTDLRDGRLDSYYYFSNQDIENVIKEIEEMIAKDEIIGLIVNPILTFEESEWYMHSYIPGLTLETIYETFKDRLPLHYCGSGGIGPFFDTPVCKKINEDYRKKGYTKENGYNVAPYILMRNYANFYDSMFNCIIDSYKKREAEGLALLRKKKESQNNCSTQNQ